MATSGQGVLIRAAAATERVRLDLARILNIRRNHRFSPNFKSGDDFARHADVLLLHGFLPSRGAF